MTEATTSFPWASVVAVAGTLLGVALTSVFNLLTEKRRWAREDTHRHTAERRDAYSELMEAANILSRERALGNDCRSDFERVVSAMTRIDLLASARMRDCLRTFGEVLAPYMRRKLGDQKAGIELMHAARSFCDEARRELGVEETDEGKG